MALTVACSCSALGALGRLLTETGPSATFDTNSPRHEFLYETIGSHRLLQNTGAITGTIARFVSGSREHSYLIQGTLAIQPSPAQLSHFLPRIFGGTPIGTSYPLADALPVFDTLIYKENGIFRSVDLMVAQAVLRGRTSNGGEGVEFMELLINVVGKSEAIDQDTWPDPEPALITTADYLPYTFWETTFAINSVDVEYSSFSMMVDNNLDVQFFNSRTPQCIRATGREIKLAIESPFTCPNLATALSLNTTADDGEFVMASGNYSTTFTFPSLKNVFQTPSIPGKQTIPLKLELEAYRTSAQAEVIITHDAVT